MESLTVLAPNELALDPFWDSAGVRESLSANNDAHCMTTCSCGEVVNKCFLLLIKNAVITIGSVCLWVFGDFLYASRRRNWLPENHGFSRISRKSARYFKLLYRWSSLKRSPSLVFGPRMPCLTFRNDSVHNLTPYTGYGIWIL